MTRSIVAALAMSFLVAPGVSAQGHQHGATPQGGGTQPADSAQAMTQMQQMHEMHQQMQAMMQPMHGQQGGAQGMQQGMQQGAQQGTCLMSGPQAGLSALLMGSAADLGLTVEQQGELQEILERARTDALEALTPEQREKLEAAPQQARPQCQQVQPSVGGAGGQQ